MLHRDEPRLLSAASAVLHLRQLPGPHRRRTDVADLASLHHIVKRLHRLLDRHPGVKPVNLVQVDVLRPEAAQGLVQLLNNCLARQARATRAVMHREEDLRRQDHVLATAVFLDRPSDDLLREAEPVRASGIPQVTASSTAWRKIGAAASSSSAHGFQPFATSPKPMHPSPIRDTFSPDRPRVTYCITAPFRPPLR